MHHALVADLRARGLGPDRHHFPDDLVAERVRQLEPKLFQLELVAAAEIEIALLQVQVAVAHPTGLHPHQDLGALRLGGGTLARLERLAPFHDLHAVHGVLSG